MDKFLHELQEDIFDGKGYFVLYLVMYFAAFTVTVDQIKIFYSILQCIWSVSGLVLIVLVYFRCKDSRDKKKNNAIIAWMFLLIALTATTVHNLIVYIS